MFETHTETLEWEGRTLTLETGKIARQADGAVVATYGETVVLATAVAQRTPRTDIDFFPLTVQYQEKTYAAGKIPGGFFKREGRPTEKEILTSRLIDRPIRPLFHKRFKNETQIICTVLSHDLENDPDIVALVAASAALTLSGVPFLGPIAAVRVGRSDDKFHINPTLATLETSELDLIVAGTVEGVLMVESQANELSEKVMLEAVLAGHKAMQPVLEAIRKLAEKAARKPWPVPAAPERAEPLETALRARATESLREAYAITDKLARRDRLEEIRSSAVKALATEEGDARILGGLCKSLESEIVRRAVLDTKSRIDGRDLDTVRAIVCETGPLPRAHGSALFTRGETQALVTTTLGTGQDEQIIDGLAGENRSSFLLHYNFPPYSVNETGRMLSPGRREIGHGKLAWRALKPLLPSREDFPYTLRVVSEITESNGSSSMATVCGASLALMDAGVPLKAPVAGIAMGLIKEEDGFAVLSDILGDEDHLGDMDFKVAGTEEGITSLQMDIKITSITGEIMQVALEQANAGRLHILETMRTAIDQPREGLSAHAPKIETISVPKEKIREIIGTGGKVIRELCELTGAKIEVNDEGLVKVASADQAGINDALERIKGIIAEPEINRVYDGKVVKVVEFGAFVNFLGTKDGLVHISQLTQGRVERVEDILNEGDTVKVQCIGFDRGKVKLSMRTVDQETGEIVEAPPPPRSPGGPRGPRRDDDFGPPRGRGGPPPRGAPRGRDDDFGPPRGRGGPPPRGGGSSRGRDDDDGRDRPRREDDDFGPPRRRRRF